VTVECDRPDLTASEWRRRSCCEGKRTMMSVCWLSTRLRAMGLWTLESELGTGPLGIGVRGVKVAEVAREKPGAV